MSESIILDSAQIIVCPICSKEFPLENGISRVVMDGYKEEFEKRLKERGDSLREELTTEATQKAKRLFDIQVRKLEETLKEKNTELQESEARAKSVKKQAEQKAQKALEVQLKGFQEELEQKDAAITKFRSLELALRKEKKDLEDARRDFELEQARRLDEAKKEITKQVVETEAERFKFKEAEYKKRLDDVTKANEDLRRKLEQGSQQAAGEVLELALEDLLKTNFIYDTITPVAKGVRGADVIQLVRTNSGQACGTIIWEAKRTQSFSEKWVQKIKDDRSAAHADIAVIVCTSKNMPKDCDEPFRMAGDVWIACDRVIRPLSETLRAALIDLAKLKALNVGKSEKMELVYNYLGSSSFAQKVSSVIETFSAMQDDLTREKKAIIKSWAKREMQLNRISQSVSVMIGELEGIGVSPQLDSISHLSLPTGEEPRGYEGSADE